MLGSLFLQKAEGRLPAIIYEMALDLFAIVQYWKPPVDGAARGRLFEKILYRHCEKRRLPLMETAGSRTVRGVRAASGIMHENDAVIACSDLTIQCELKHLSGEVSKNDLLIFNQKGIDYLCAEDQRLRRLPLYRIFLSGNLLNPSARRFALQWGIVVIEPDRLPLALVHWLSGYAIDNLRDVSLEEQDGIWEEIPHLLVSLQNRIRRASRVLDDEEMMVGQYRINYAIDHIQRVIGDHYWSALDERDPYWLEDRFEAIADELGLDNLG